MSEDTSFHSVSDTLSSSEEFLSSPSVQLPGVDRDNTDSDNTSSEDNCSVHSEELEYDDNRSSIHSEELEYDNNCSVHSEELEYDKNCSVHSEEPGYNDGGSSILTTCQPESNFEEIVTLREDTVNQKDSVIDSAKDSKYESKDSSKDSHSEDQDNKIEIAFAARTNTPIDSKSEMGSVEITTNNSDSEDLKRQSSNNLVCISSYQENKALIEEKQQCELKHHHDYENGDVDKCCDSMPSADFEGNLFREHSYDDIETLGICRYKRNSGTPVTSTGNSRPGSALSSGTVFENDSSLYENLHHTSQPALPVCEENSAGDGQQSNRFNLQKLDVQPSPRIDYFRKLKHDKKQKNDSSLSIDETSTFAIDQDLETSTCNELSHSLEEVLESSETGSSHIILEKSPPPARKREKPTRHSSLLQNFFKRRKSSIELEETVKHNSLPPGVKGVMTELQMQEESGEELQSEDDSLVQEFQSENEYENMETLDLKHNSPVNTPAGTPEQLCGSTHSLDQHSSQAIHLSVKPLSFEVLKRQSLGATFWIRLNQPFVLPVERSNAFPTAPSTYQTNNLENVDDQSMHMNFESLKVSRRQHHKVRKRRSSFNLPQYPASDQGITRRKQSVVKSAYQSLRGATRKRVSKKSSSETYYADFDTLSISKGSPTRGVQSNSFYLSSGFSLPRRRVIKSDTFLTPPENPLTPPDPVPDGTTMQDSSSEALNHASYTELQTEVDTRRESSEDMGDYQGRMTGLRAVFRIGRLSLLRPSIKLKSRAENSSGHNDKQLASCSHTVSGMSRMDSTVVSMNEMNVYD